MLVVDDIEEDQWQIARILKSEFHISTAYSGTEALERLEHEDFEVVVSDQKMPRMLGDELIGHIKEDPRTAHVRCILLSGRAGPEQLVEILRGGRVYHYFEKNKTLLKTDGKAELVLAVRSAVQASRLERERERLTRRLRAQVDTVNSQYRLLRTLVNVSEPPAVLRLVVQNLAQRVSCRGAVGLVDLLPEQGVFSHIAARDDAGSAVTTGDAQGWMEWARSEYTRLSGRSADAANVTQTPELLASGEPVGLPAQVPTIPVFVERDLRGVLVVVRDTPLEAEELGVLEVWRDQLQDALTRVRAQMLDEQRRIELMVETMDEGVVLTDEHGAVSLMNPAARRMLGLADLDRPDFTVIVSAMGLSNVDVLRQLGVGEGKMAWREIRLADRYFKVLFANVRDSSGGFVGVLTVIRDVTAQKVSEQRREEFVHIIGHELRSPLTSIGGVLDLLSKQVLGDLNGRQREYVEMAKDSCVKINRLLNDLLDLAKFEQGKLQVNLESIDLRDVVIDGVRRFEPVAIEKGVELRFECLTEGLLCQADPDRLGQVTSNLLSNALKFTPRGGSVSVSIITAYTAPELYLVAVHNTGEEIAEGDLDRIFDKFEQVAMLDRRSVGGTGLGLSICRNIIEGHGGRIWVESGRGEGTSFVFSLPMASVGRDTGSSLAPITARPRAEDDPVLLVADDQAEAFALKAMLLSMEFKVRICPARVEAVSERVASHQPALAVYLDLEGAPAEDVLAELAGHNDLPVVSLLPSGTPVPSTVDMGLDVPLDPTVLGSMLNVVRVRQRQRRRMRVLVADRDVAWAGEVAEHLDEAGYLPYTATGAALAEQRIDSLLPDLVVLDLGMPEAGRVVERLRGETGVHIPALFTNVEQAPEADESVATIDVLARELPARELLVAVRNRLARDRRRSDTLIVLPGARELQREVQSRMREWQPYAYCAVDIVGLRDAIDRNGFVWGLGAMTHTAELVHRVLQEHADKRAFFGQQRDDDFVFLCAPAHVETVCAEIRRGFEHIVALIADAGHSDGATLSLSITAVTDETGRFETFSALQAYLGMWRERNTGEVVLIDRGRDTPGAGLPPEE